MICYPAFWDINSTKEFKQFCDSFGNTPRHQVRCQRYLLYAYLWAPFWQIDGFTSYNRLSVTDLRVPKPLACDLSLDKAPSRSNHLLEVTAIKSLSQSVVLPIFQLHDVHRAFLMCCFAQIFQILFVLPDTTPKPWELVRGLCSRRGKQKKPMSMKQCEELALLLLKSILRGQFLLDKL